MQRVQADKPDLTSQPPRDALKTATLDDLREAVETLEELTRTARRVLGGAHPLAMHIEGTLARAKLRFQELEEASAPSMRAPEVD